MTDKTMTLEQAAEYGWKHASWDLENVLIGVRERHLSQPAERGEAVGQLSDVAIALLSDGTDATIYPASPAMKGHTMVYTSAPPAAGVPDELVRMTIRALDDVDTEMRATGRATNRFSQLVSDWRGMLSAAPSPTIDVAAVREVISRVAADNQKSALTLGVEGLRGQCIETAKELHKLARAIGDAK